MRNSPRRHVDVSTIRPGRPLNPKTAGGTARMVITIILLFICCSDGFAVHAGQHDTATVTTSVGIIINSGQELKRLSCLTTVYMGRYII